MISDNLNTNQVKNAAGTEIEFELKSRSENRAEWKKTSEVPGLPFRLVVQHQNIGSGVNQRRRSNLSILKLNQGGIDALKSVKTVCSFTLDIPVGNMPNQNLDDAKEVLAAAISMIASTGADTVVKFDGTGTAASALLNETL